MDWVAQALAGGGLLAGFVVAWKLHGSTLRDIISTQREASEQDGHEREQLHADLAETRAALAEARNAVGTLTEQLQVERIAKGEQRVLKHDALGRVQSYMLERGLIREMAERHGCLAIIDLLDRMDSVRKADPNLPDPPRRRGEQDEPDPEA